MNHFHGLPALLLAGTAIPSFAQADDQRSGPGEARSDRYFVGYYRADNLAENSSLPLASVKYSYYTHIIHIGLAVGSDGQPSPATPTMPSREFTAAVHQNGVLGLISLVGGKQNFEKVARDPEALERFVSDMARIVAEFDYDGIDVDWEHPDSPEAGKGWMTFMAALREMLDGLAENRQRRFWLTTALPAGWGGAHLDGKRIADTVDFINVMCYDGFGPWGGRAGNHAPLFPDPADPRQVSMASGMAYWRDTVGVPADSLVMGLPFYAYVCTGYEPYEPIDKDAEGKSVDGGSAWMGNRSADRARRLGAAVQRGITGRLVLRPRRVCLCRGRRP